METIVAQTNQSRARLANGTACWFRLHQADGHLIQRLTLTSGVTSEMVVAPAGGTVTIDALGSVVLVQGKADLFRKAGALPIISKPGQTRLRPPAYNPCRMDISHVQSEPLLHPGVREPAFGAATGIRSRCDRGPSELELSTNHHGKLRGSQAPWFAPEIAAADS